MQKYAEFATNHGSPRHQILNHILDSLHDGHGDPAVASLQADTSCHDVCELCKLLDFPPLSTIFHTIWYMSINVYKVSPNSELVSSERGQVDVNETFSRPGIGSANKGIAFRQRVAACLMIQNTSVKKQPKKWCNSFRSCLDLLNEVPIDSLFKFMTWSKQSLGKTCVASGQVAIRQIFLFSHQCCLQVGSCASQFLRVWGWSLWRF